ncbi:MAG: FtsX-like permease family protein [Pseudomonadota bacterium]
MSVAGPLSTFGNWRVFQAIVWQPLRAQAGRTFLAIIAITLGVALGYSIHLMNRAATTEMTHATRSLFGQADWVIQSTSQGFDESLFPAIARIPGIAVASPVVEVRVRVLGHTHSLLILGMDPMRAGQLQPALPQSSSQNTEAENEQGGRSSLSFFNSKNVLLNDSAAKTLGLKVGDTLTVQLGIQPVAFAVAGILPGDVYGQDVGLLDIAAAQWRLEKLGKLTRIDIRLAPGADTAAVSKAIRRLLPVDVKLTTPTDEAQQSLQLSRAFRVNITALALVALFTGAFLVYSTQSLAIIRRRREFALLHALGVTAREQRGSVILTGGLLGAIGAMAGVALGIVLARVGLQTMPDSTATQVQVIPWELCGFALLGMAVAIAGSIAPAMAAARIPTSQALKAGNVEQANNRGHAYYALLLWALAIPLLFSPPLFNLPLLGYTAIAFILFGSVLLIPAFTRFSLSLLPNRSSVTYQTAVAQLRGVAHTATTSVATMLVSVSLMVAMSIMGASLRGSVAELLERTYPADIYVQTDAQLASYLNTNTVKAIESIPDIERTAPGRSISLLLDNNPLPVMLLARPTDLDNPGATLELEKEGEGLIPGGAVPIWISVSLANREQLTLQSELHFHLAGQDIVGSVRGIYRAYLPVPSFQMDYQQYAQLTRDDQVNSLGIWLKPNTSAETVISLVRERIGKGSEIDITLPGESREKILKGFDSAFGIVYLLLAVSVLIGLFGIGVNASAQVLARRAEFGMLRHLGFTRGQIGRVLSIEGLCLGTLGVLSGLLVGCVISAVMILVVTPQSFHWTMDLHIPWTILISLALLVPAASALTALWSGRSAMNDDVVRAVKEDW